MVVTRGLLVRTHGISRAAVARRAIDEAAFGSRLEILHLSELLVDRPMHDCHLAGSALRALIILGKICIVMTMSASYPQGAAVTQIHDEEEPARRNALEPLDVLEYLFRGLLFMFRDPSLDLFNISVVGLLD